jgi:uncharacterized protein (AIM24 family)
VRRLAAVVVVIVLVGAACGGSSHSAIKLDGSPRHPDDQGIVTAVSLTKLTIDGRRSYVVDRSLRCFSTVTLAPIQLLGRRGQYVQVGLRGHTIDWLAGFGAVVRAQGDPPTVYYSGTVKRVARSDMTFADGTVLALGPDVTGPVGLPVRVQIDPDHHVARSVTVI